MKSPEEINSNLINSQVFRDWQKKHSGFLSHFFSSLSSRFELKSSWEIGYYCSKDNKISIFVHSESSFILKQEDDIFKDGTTEIEQLDLSKVNKTLEEVSETCKQKLPELFKKEILGDGFVILQTLNGNPFWNFTFVSNTLKFANIKIDAMDSKVLSHQLVEAVIREK